MRKLIWTFFLVTVIYGYGSYKEKKWIAEISFNLHNMIEKRPFFFLEEWPEKWGREDVSIDRMSGFSIGLWHNIIKIKRLSIGGCWGKEWGKVSTDWETPYFSYEVEVYFLTLAVRFMLAKLFQERLGVFLQIQPGVFNGKLYSQISESRIIIKNYDNNIGIKAVFGLDMRVNNYLSIITGTGLEYFKIYYTVLNSFGRTRATAFKSYNFYISGGLGVNL